MITTGQFLRAAVAVVSLCAASGCLVLSLTPVYDDNTIAWEPGLVGHWVDADDNAVLNVERGEWRSYRVHYEHPIESGDLTGYLTTIGDERYLDLTPIRGADRGSFLVPVHAILRVRLQGDTLDVAPLSYDWFVDRVRAARDTSGLALTRDQKENVLILSPPAKLRTWLRGQPQDGAMFGAAATFTRK